VHTDYGVILAEVAHTPHIELPLRQLASVVLKQYVEGHWSQESSKFCEPQVTAESRRVIKHLLLASLGSEESKIRAAAVSGAWVGGAVEEWATGLLHDAQGWSGALTWCIGLEWGSYMVHRAGVVHVVGLCFTMIYGTIWYDYAMSCVGICSVSHCCVGVARRVARVV